MFEPDYFMHETYATDDTAYVFARRGLQSAWTYTPVQKHEIVSEVTTTLLDSLFVNRMLAMPTSEVLIFQGATQKEYREEEEDISRQIEEFERENPGVGCEWGGPRGYWRVFNTRTKKHSRLDQQYEYIAATRSGRHILVRREDDRSVFSVVKTSEIIK